MGIEHSARETPLDGGPFTNLGHLRWLEDMRASLLDFYQPGICLPSGGYAYLDDAGFPIPDRGAELWLGARMLHCFALAHMLGRPGASDVVEHGLDFYVDGAGWDEEYGGFYATVGGAEPSDRKELYGQAHVLLAASTALTAGFERAPMLFGRAVETIEKFWIESDGRCLDSYNRELSTRDRYRGQNANMHLTEAYLAAYEASGDEVFLERALRIARSVAGRAASEEDGSWRLPEHFSENWEPLLEFNRSRPRDPFRPYGSQPGHWLEWSKLISQLLGQGADEEWMEPAARRLFVGAFKDGWSPGGGFCYTVDWEGRPVVAEKFFWETPEGIGAARFLHARTRESSFAERYVELWDWTDQYLVDHELGSLFPELNASNEPVNFTWIGKPDLYHALQATMYANLGPDEGLATWASKQQERERI